MMHNKFRVGYVAASLLFSLNALAVRRTVSVTLDVNQLSATTSGTSFTRSAIGSPAFSTISPFSLATGDTLDYTIDFLGSQTLTITNMSYIWGHTYASSGGNQQVNGTGTLQLLDTSGAVLYTAGPKTDSEINVHFGQFFFANQFNTILPNTIVIGGLHYVGTVNSYTPVTAGVDPVITTRTYNLPAFEVVTTVPEPSALALMLLGGIVVIGKAVRRGVCDSAA